MIVLLEVLQTLSMKNMLTMLTTFRREIRDHTLILTTSDGEIIQISHGEMITMLSNRLRDFKSRFPLRIFHHSKNQSRVEELLLNFIQQNETNMKSHQATIKNLKNQIGHMAQQLSNKPSRSLPSNTE